MKSMLHAARTRANCPVLDAPFITDSMIQTHRSQQGQQHLL
jgi:hypothetical protein